MYQAIELFLKDALYRVNPLLIYVDIDKQVGDDSRTVGFKDIGITRAKLSESGFDVLVEPLTEGKDEA